MKNLERLKALEEELNAIPSGGNPANVIEGKYSTSVSRNFWTKDNDLLYVSAYVAGNTWRTNCNITTAKLTRKRISLPKALQLAKTAALSA